MSENKQPMLKTRAVLRRRSGHSKVWARRRKIRSPSQGESVPRSPDPETFLSASGKKIKTILSTTRDHDMIHCSDYSTSLETRHQMCPRTPDSWCKYQLDKLNGTSMYNDKPGIPAIIRDTIKPIFLNLSDDDLLKKCLHGKTQNNNESLNGMIWKRCPKDVFVGKTTIEIGVASAVLNFNDGSTSILDVITSLKMDPGYFTKQYCVSNDERRICSMERKSTPVVQQQRKSLRARRKGFIDSVEQKEGGVSYASGSFHSI